MLQIINLPARRLFATGERRSGSPVALVAFFIFVRVRERKNVPSDVRRAIGTDAPDNIITNRGDTRGYKNKWP